MTATRKRPTAPVLDVTLEQFGEQINDHLGRDVGYAAAVADYRRGADLAAALTPQGELRAAVAATLGRMVDTGQARSGIGEVCRRRAGGGPVRVLRSAAVKAAQPGLWTDSRKAQRSMAVASTGAVARPRVVRAAPVLFADVWAVYDSLRSQASEANALRTEARSTLLAIHREVSALWNATPLVTADGWTVGENVQARWNSGRCRALAQQRDIDLEPLEAVEQHAPRVFYVLVEPGGGEDDWDEIDGQ